MLCSPIILYDYPKIAPESEGDYFDGTEMDEMLTFRVLTLTDAEKQEIRMATHAPERSSSAPKPSPPRRCSRLTASSAPSARIKRTASSSTSFSASGTRSRKRRLRRKASCLRHELRVGDRVRQCPQKNADIMDMALASKVGIIEAIEQDFEDQVQFAVVLDDDPGREFGMMRHPVTVSFTLLKRSSLSPRESSGNDSAHIAEDPRRLRRKIFLGDDGFGVEVARSLTKRPCPENSIGEGLRYSRFRSSYALLEPWDAVIFVDALPRNEAPGTLIRRRARSLRPRATPSHPTRRSTPTEWTRSGSSSGSSIGAISIAVAGRRLSAE